MNSKVWTEVNLHPEALARLQARVDVVVGTPDTLPGAEAAIIGRSRVDAAFIERAGPSLKLVIRHGIGYNTLDVPAATRYGVLAANTPDAPTESTAEQAVGLLLAVAKLIVKSDMVLRAHAPIVLAELRGVEVLDRVLGVVGYGRIGRRVTEICALGLRMRVVVFDPYLSAAASLPEGVSMVESLDALLPRVDFLTLHTPLMPETYHLIGERELQLMKPGSFLINVSRGPVVDEAALIRALESGHLAGAGLDVFDPEPPMPDNPLLRMTNVVVTPHVASNTDRGYWRMSQSVVDQVLQVLAGERPSFLIDPAAWPGRMGTPPPQEYPPVDPDLAPYARTVLNRFAQYKGQYWIAGQQEIHWDVGLKDEMSNRVYDRTNPHQYPGLRGWDVPFGGQYPNDAQWMIDTIIDDWRTAQVLPTISNHWSPISPHLYDEMFNHVSVDNIFTEGTWERAAYLTWRENMADDLQTLQDAQVPVLWRPYHEGGGGWFWWDRDGPSQYRRLWHDLYDYMVNTRGLHNLIWVWTRGVIDQDPDWYPGDSRVDIISGDVYNETSGDYRGLYNDLERFSSTRLRALTECDYLMSPDLLGEAPFAYFMVWHSEHLTRNSDDRISTVYNHARSITRARMSQYLDGTLDGEI